MTVSSLRMPSVSLATRWCRDHSILLSEHDQNHEIVAALMDKRQKEYGFDYDQFLGLKKAMDKALDEFLDF